MKKIILFLVIILAVVIILGLFYLNANSASIISTFLSNQFKSEVVVENASLGFGEIELSGVRIVNPTSGSIADNFKAEKVDVKFDYTTLFKDTINIQAITIKNPTIYIELNNLTGSDNNWKPIFKSLSFQDVPPHPNENGVSKVKKLVVIDTLTIDNLNIQAQHSLLGPYSLNIPIKDHIVFHDLTNHQALAYKAALTVIFKSLLESLTYLKGFKEIFKDIQLSPAIPADIFTNISAQAPKEAPEQPLPSKNVTKWQELKDEVQEAPKKVKEFFNDLFR
ncbi:MAG: hypothetical protein P4L16_05385 [Chlamydiales bacterium]|nr:hypothetical protein [Chlamydiales bacterium]